MHEVLQRLLDINLRVHEGLSAVRPNQVMEPTLELGRHKTSSVDHLLVPRNEMAKDDARALHDCWPPDMKSELKEVT